MNAEVIAAIEQERKARMTGQLQHALAEYVQAVAMAKDKNLTTELIVALEGVGQIERDSGRLETACARYLEAIEVCRDANDPLRLAHALRHVADIDLERGENEAAARSASEAVEIYRQHPEVSSLELANALRVWALAQETEGNSVGAASVWLEARRLYEAEGIDEGVRECEAQLRGRI